MKVSIDESFEYAKTRHNYDNVFIQTGIKDIIDEAQKEFLFYFYSFMDNGTKASKALFQLIETWFGDTFK